MAEKLEVHIDDGDGHLYSVIDTKTGGRVWGVIECNVLGCWCRKRSAHMGRTFVEKVYGNFEIRRSG